MNTQALDNTGDQIARDLAMDSDWPADFPPKESVDPRKSIIDQISINADAWGRWLDCISDATDQGFFDNVNLERVSDEFAQTLPNGSLFIYLVLPNDKIFGSVMSPDDWAFSPNGSAAGSRSHLAPVSA